MINPRVTRVKVAIALGLAIGVALRVARWIVDPPIWLDEAMLALGIVHRPLGAVLAAPLPYAQSAPPGFLVVQWTIISALGTSGRALRLSPLIASLIALPTFAQLARRVLRDDYAVIAAVWLFSINRALVNYSVVAKPYAWDVLAAIAIIYATLWAMDDGPLRALGAGTLGAALAWCSLPASLVLIACAAVWVTRAARSAAIAIPIWMASALPAVWTMMNSVAPADRAYLRAFWAPAFGIHPVRALDDLLRIPPGFFWLAAIIAGIALVRQRWVLVAPAGITMIAAIAGLYPFASRLMLFLLPSALFAVAALARAPVGGWIVVAFVAAQGVESVLPERHEDMRTVASALARARRPGDAVYVYYGAIPTFAYYADTTGITRGGCHRNDWRAYVSELDAFRGKHRVWLVVAHAFDRNGVQEDSLLVRYLDATGHPYLTIRANSAFAKLYDLSEPTNAVIFSPPVSIRRKEPNLVCRVL
jgi:hypothetical protein